MSKYNDESLMPFTDYGSVMRRKFGGRVQKLALDAGFTCPNRDGKVGVGGCSFCAMESFSPSYCREARDLYEQLDLAVEFHATRRRLADYYFAYLQAGSNTYANVNTLRCIYSAILRHSDISGLIIGTRPDCVDSEILQLLEDLSNKGYIAVEYGIESVDDATLRHVGRGHDFAVARWAVAETRKRKIDVGAHFIIGLPNRTKEQTLAAVNEINSLGINYIKFHQLQVHASTRLAEEYRLHPERFMLRGKHALEEYVELMVEIVRRLDPRIAIDRFASSSPLRDVIHSPLGGVSVADVRRMIGNRLTALGARQGDLFSPDTK